MTDTDSPAAMIDLTGRVILVTGAGAGGSSGSVGGIVGSGIGSGIVRRFVAAGATVVAHTRNSPTDHLRYPDGTPVATVRADLTTPGGPPGVISETLGLHGRLDGLVNNAGAQPIARFDTLSDEQFTDMMDINVTATHRLTQLAAAAMRANRDPGGGSIVHIASIEARHPTVMHGHYATSKAALVMHARAAALMYGPDGIRVNTVSPGAHRPSRPRGRLAGGRPPLPGRRAAGPPRHPRGRGRRLRVPLLGPLTLDHRHRPARGRRRAHQHHLVTRWSSATASTW